jgi:filamentous hemagglutinin
VGHVSGAADQRANPTINGYALYQQLNKDNNGDIGAILAATGYTLGQYYALASSDYNSGRPQGQAFDVGMQDFNSADAASFLKFNGLIAASGGGAALAVAGAPSALAWGQEALAAYKTAAAGYSLTAGAATGGVASGAIYTANAGIGAGIDAYANQTSFGAAFNERFSYQGFTGSVIVGSLGGIYQTQMFEWAGIPNALSNWLTPAGAVIRVNKTAAGMSGGKATQAAIQANQNPEPAKKSN